MTHFTPPTVDHIADTPTDSAPLATSEPKLVFGTEADKTDARALALGRRFIDALRGEGAGTHAPSDKDGEAYDLDIAFGEVEEPRRHLGRDDALAAILLASTLASDPALLRGLRTGDIALGILLPEGMRGDVVRRVIDKAVTPESVEVVSDADRGYGFSTRKSGPCLVVLEVEARRHAKRRLDEQLRRAEDLEMGVVVLAERGTELGEDATAHLDHILALTLRPRLVPFLIEQMTRQSLDGGDADRLTNILEDIRPGDLLRRVSRRRAPAEIIDLLRTDVEARRRASRTLSDVPPLEELSGYGAAKAVGLEIVTDMRAFAEGRLAWGDVPPGLVLEGPPGVGKTFLAQALARSAGLPLVVGSFAA